MFKCNNDYDKKSRKRMSLYNNFDWLVLSLNNN